MKVKDEEFIMCVRLGAGREERTSGGENCLCKNVWERDRDTEREMGERHRERWRERQRHTKRDGQTKMERD